MKVVITCDHLLERDHSVEVVETLLEIYEDAEIYTLAHNQGKILGPIEQRRITSTYLSHKLTSLNDLKKYYFMLPTAARSLQIPCSVELIINVTSGFSHGIKRCEKTKQMSYIYDLVWKQRPKTFAQKFFYAYCKFWANGKLKQAQKILLGHRQLSGWLNCAEPVEHVYPPINLDEFQPRPRQGTKKFVLINCEDVEAYELEKIYDDLLSKRLPFQFVGKDDHLDKLKDKIGSKFFLGSLCYGELAPLINESHGVVDLVRDRIPVFGLFALALRRPVWMKESTYALHSLPEGLEVKAFSDSQLIDYGQEADEREGRQAMPLLNFYHPTKFKTTIQKYVSSLNS